METKTPVHLEPKDGPKRDFEKEALNEWKPFKERQLRNEVQLLRTQLEERKGQYSPPAPVVFISHPF